MAAASGNDGAVLGLVEEGAPVNPVLTDLLKSSITTEDIPLPIPAEDLTPGMTPSILAAACGRTAALKALLDARANASARDSAGRTALMYAARYGHEATVRLLLSHGVDVDALDLAGLTALMHVAQLGASGLAARGGPSTKRADADTAIASDLIADGANPDCKNLNGDTALDIARKSGNSAVSLYLTKLKDGSK